MAASREVICIDTSILIDFFRKKNKVKTPFFRLAKRYEFSISVITKFEILNGSNDEQKMFWEQLFRRIRIVPLGEREVDIASDVFKKLKSQNKIIDLPDIFIGATALSNNLKLATLNTAHFERIESLTLIAEKAEKN